MSAWYKYDTLDHFVKKIKQKHRKLSDFQTSQCFQVLKSSKALFPHSSTLRARLFLNFKGGLLQRVNQDFKVAQGLSEYTIPVPHQTEKLLLFTSRQF